MSDTPHPSRGTTAHVPDLNWSQVRETVLMLELASAQIEAAMTESNTSVEVLADSFTSMAGHMGMIADSLQSLPDEGEVGQLKQNLLGTSDHVAGMVQKTIVAFQFYDRLVQRLSHVSHSLGALGELVSDPQRLHNPHEWVGLQEKIRSRYSMREEAAMFDAVVRGVPVQEAIDRYMAEIKDKSDDIELF